MAANSARGSRRATGKSVNATPAEETGDGTGQDVAQSATIRNLPSLADLVARAKEAKEMPKIARGGGAAENPFIEALRKSKEGNGGQGQPMQLPAVPNEEAAKSVKLSIRRAAQLAGLGVSIREEETDEGIVIWYMGKEKQSRDA